MKTLFAKQNIFWFIEKISNQKWIDEFGYLTNIPLKAKQFKTKLKALEYMIIHKLSDNIYHPTEHEFM